MILSVPDIRRAVLDGEIVFDPPLEDNQWGEASVDLRLGFQFTKFKDVGNLTISVASGLSTIGSIDLWTTMNLKPKDQLGRPERSVLHPKEKPSDAYQDQQHPLRHARSKKQARAKRPTASRKK